jgi:predicted transposase YdaD
MLEETLREWGQKMLQQGRQEGQLEMQKLVLEMLRDRFGSIPQTARQRIKEISSLPELRKFARRVLTANSLQETGLL